MTRRSVPIAVRYGEHLLSCHTLNRPVERMLGLIARRWRELGVREGVILPCCSSIHTFGMSGPIDVCFVDTTSGIVLSSKREVAPNRLITVKGADTVIERYSSITSWPMAGSSIGFESP